MFIEKLDFDASVHAEILNALTREDNEVLALLVERAVAEMEGYLSARYDTAAIFTARGADRLQIVVMMCVDIAVYHAYCLANPIKLSAMRKERYERAVDWLKAVQKGTTSIAGAPVVPDREVLTGFYFSSNRKRCNHF
jgi:phage gp36-like protein